MIDARAVGQHDEWPARGAIEPGVQRAAETFKHKLSRHERSPRSRFGQIEHIEEAIVEVKGVELEGRAGDDNLDDVGHGERLGGMPGALVVQPFGPGAGASRDDVDDSPRGSTWLARSGWLRS
jgi:hypothetical protein